MSFLFCCAVEYYSVLKVSRAGKQVKSSYVVGIVAVFVTFQVSGHHSGTIFDRNSIVTLVGTVTHYDWTNPHVYVYLEVRDAGGKLNEWQLELDATAISMRSGWTSNTLIPGDIVTVRGNPDRRSRNRNHALLISLRTPDGTILEPRTGGRASNVRATGIGGVWDGLRGANTRTYIYGEAQMYGNPEPDFKESFVWGLDIKEDDSDFRAGGRLLAPNRWPGFIPGMREKLVTYFQEAQICGQRLLKAFAKGLDIDPEFFLKDFNKPVSRGALIYYPLQKSPPVEHLGSGAHTDYGTLTLLYQDEVGGLEIKGKSGAWLSATPIKGTYVVNVGDLLARWSNRSTP